MPGLHSGIDGHAFAQEQGWLTSRELCARTGITYRQLDYWTRLGILKPEVPAAGSGTMRAYRPAEAAVAAAVLASGVRPDSALGRQVAGHVRRFGLRGRIPLTPSVDFVLDRVPDPCPPPPAAATG